MKINQQRKPPAKRAFIGLPGSPLAHVVETDELRKQREKEEAQIAAKASAVDATIQSMKQVNDANRIGAIPAETPKRGPGRPPSPDGPKSPAVRKRESRERKILEELEAARRQAITATLDSSITHGQQRNEIVVPNSKIEVISAAKWRSEHIGGRRVRPTGHSLKSMEDESGNPRSPQYATKETDSTFVKRQKWPLNWRLTPSQMEYYVAELTGGLLDDKGNRILGIFNYADSDGVVVAVCSLCGGTVSDWNEGPPFVSFGRPGDERDTILGGACGHLWLSHKKLVNEYLREVAPARVPSKKKRKCPAEDHERIAKTLAANDFDCAQCKLCQEWIWAASPVPAELS
jgi:hypothetical protein